MTAIIKGRGVGSGSGSNSTNSFADQDVIASLLRHWYLIFFCLVALIAILITSVRWDDISTVTAMKYVGTEHDDTADDLQGVGALDPKIVELATRTTSSTGTTQRQRPQNWDRERTKTIKRIGAKCNFPDFFYKNQEYVKYRLSSVGEYIGHNWRQREKRRLLTGKYEYDRDDDYDPPRAVQRTDLARKMSYIHIGKAGGSSVSCSIREARKYGVGKQCGRVTRFNEPEYNETAISHQVDCYSHYNYNGFCFGEGRSYLYNVRNPIHRIKSWYLYEHYLNQPITQSAFKHKKPHCGNIMLGTCYKNFDELASIGLSGSRPSDSGKLRIASNLSTDECSDWAWAVVTGEIPASYHNAFNFDWYFAPMLEEQYQESEIFVVRVEHLHNDWQAVDRIVGGDGKTLPGDVMLAGAESKVNVAADMNLPVSNSTLSPLGWRNLCRAMCHEMQIYKMMLQRASNLNEDDVKESIEELREICPEETHEIRSECM